MEASSFFRWKPTVIILWLFGVLFGLVAAANMWLVVIAARGSIHGPSTGDSQRLIRMILRGAIEDFAVAALCPASWYSMRRKTRVALMAGAAAVTVALFITSARWFFWEIRSANPLSWIEPVCVWPLMVYTIIYALRESRPQNAA
jgi:hypothetical protein